MTHSDAISRAEVPALDQLKGRARELLPLLRAHAAETEKTGRIPAVVLDAIRDAGLLRLSSPLRFGGFQLPFRAMAEVMLILAQGCGSTAWIAAYTNTAKWMASLWNAKAQNEFFSRGPDFIMAGSGHRPSADVQRVEGGYRFSGSWNSLSGVPYADWVGVWLRLPDADGEPGKVVEAVVPAAEVEIVNTWNVVGMKGTGSESVVAKNVFVPLHRVTDVSVFERNDWQLYPTPYKDEALYRAAAHPILALAICFTPAGLAIGALDHVLDTADKPLLGTRYSQARESVSFQNQVSRASMHVETARLFLLQAAADIDEFAVRGAVMPVLDRARVRAYCGWIVSHACTAIDLLMTAAGPKAFADSSPMQRAWRDANTSARHGAVNELLNTELYGKALLGIEETTNILKI